jgi:hypothetical protein
MGNEVSLKEADHATPVLVREVIDDGRMLGTRSDPEKLGLAGDFIQCLRLPVGRRRVGRPVDQEERAGGDAMRDIDGRGLS